MRGSKLLWNMVAMALDLPLRTYGYFCFDNSSCSPLYGSHLPSEAMSFCRARLSALAAEQTAAAWQPFVAIAQRVAQHAAALHRMEECMCESDFVVFCATDTVAKRARYSQIRGSTPRAATWRATVP